MVTRTLCELDYLLRAQGTGFFTGSETLYHLTFAQSQLHLRLLDLLEDRVDFLLLLLLFSTTFIACVLHCGLRATLSVIVFIVLSSALLASHKQTDVEKPHVLRACNEPGPRDLRESPACSQSVPWHSKPQRDERAANRLAVVFVRPTRGSAPFLLIKSQGMGYSLLDQSVRNHLQLCMTFVLFFAHVRSNSFLLTPASSQNA